MGLFKKVDEANSKYYFNVETNTVEKGLVSDWNHRMGPYDTEAEAKQALETVRKRNEKWDADDAEWNS